MRDSLNKYVKIFAWIFPGIISIFLLSCNFKQQKHAEILFWGMGAEGEQVKSLIPVFEKLNPKIKVKVQMIPWTAAQEKLITAYASNNLPDAFQLGNTWIPQFVALNAIASLDDGIKNSTQINRD